MTEELKPCPFCGGTKPQLCIGYHARTDAKVSCDHCGSEGPVFGTDDYSGASHESEARAAWNNRATDDLALLSLLADIRKAAGDAEGRLMQDELVARIEALRATLIDTAGNLRRMADDEFEDCDHERLNIVLDRIDGVVGE